MKKCLTTVFKVELVIILFLFSIIFCVNAKNEPIKKEMKDHFTIKGIQNVYLLNNINLYLNELDEQDLNLKQDDFLLLVTKQLEKSLKPYGYYKVKTHFNVINKDSIELNIDLGKPIFISETDVQIKGQGSNDKEILELNKTKIPAKKDILRHYKYDDYKKALDEYATLHGYFDAEYEKSALEIDTNAALGNWRIIYNTGDRYKFGKISLSNSQIKDNYINALLPFSEGHDYSLQSISDSQHDLYDADWFNSVDFIPKVDKQAKTVDMDIKFTPNKKNRMALSLGYDTSLGVNAGVKWTKPWINSRGHSISSDLFLSKPKKDFAITYKLPLATNPLKYYYEFSSNIKKERNIDVPYDSYEFSALRFWKPAKKWQFGFGFGTLYSIFKENNLRKKSFLFYASGLASRTRVDNEIFPYWGDQEQLTVNVGRKKFLSDVDFLHIKLNLSFIRSIQQEHRFILRTGLGYLKTKKFNDLAPQFRFYVGGDRSIRGFPYNSISDKNANGALVGSRKSFTASIEYQYKVYKDFWAAVFYDTGLASYHYKKTELNIGAGIGVRWASPIGSVRFDVAKPIKYAPTNNKKSKLQFYIGIGSEL